MIKGNCNTTKLIAELKKSPSTYMPLDKEQEEALIAENKHDREKLNDLLFKHNIRLVFNLAKRYMSKTDDFDSMVQDGMLGLKIATQEFDVERGTKFITFATWWILKKMREHYYSKNYKVIKNSVSLSEPSTCNSKINDNDANDLESHVNDMIDPAYNNIKTIEHQLSANEQSAICKDLYQTLEEDSKLSSLEKKVFVDIYYNKEKTRIVKQKYNVTSSQIASIKSYALSMMKEKLKTKYDITSFDELYEA